ncbi:TRAM domain-containing protein [Halorubrum laminariae]|uniref:TRAM domain-containing protein n=1 Tax=Halorubrum laminariae TaxID=1433523 RepID=A0ABD6BXG9_9EURY|nr:TRAM domain-containing protein [Halorubrum laminariae]
MVEITDSLACLFTGEIEERDGEHVVTVPESEIEHGTLEPGKSYRVALIARETAESTSDGSETDPGQTSGRSRSGNGATPGTSSSSATDTAPSGPPVSEGDIREVTIETLGDKGDGIAKIERGYVVIVPDSEPGDQPTVEITSVRENVSFADVIDE